MGDITLGDRVSVAVSERVSIHERIAATVALGMDFTEELAGSVLMLFSGVDGVSRVGVRRRKLTRFKND